MNVDKDEVTIVATILGFLGMMFGGGRAYEQLVSKINNEKIRIDVIEKQPPFVLMSSCEERRAGCGRENKMQFDAGERQFVELKKLISDNDRSSNERHAEIMKILMEMNRHG